MNIADDGVGIVVPAREASISEEEIASVEDVKVNHFGNCSLVYVIVGWSKRANAALSGAVLCLRDFC